jgi:hypothetical protein
MSSRAEQSPEHVAVPTRVVRTTLAVSAAAGTWLLHQTRQAFAQLGGLFRVLREDSFQARSAQRAQAVQERRRHVHRAGAPASEGNEPRH